MTEKIYYKTVMFKSFSQCYDIKPYLLYLPINKFQIFKICKKASYAWSPTFWYITYTIFTKQSNGYKKMEPLEYWG